MAPSQAEEFINKGTSRRRFTFKTNLERIEEIDIDVFRSLHPLKDVPSSDGSPHFLACLTECRELNTAEDFISFYNEFFPLVQILPQIILHKDLIISNLLSRLTMEGRLSLEAILRLISALSRDLLDDFMPFLPEIVKKLVSLLEKGADNDPEIIEQIFTSWSCIVMYLQKYLIKEVVHILSITSDLRYYHKDYVRELMAKALSFLLRKAPIQQLNEGLGKLMTEVVDKHSKMITHSEKMTHSEMMECSVLERRKRMKESRVLDKELEMRKSGVVALLSHVMRITPSRLHSRTETLMPLLVDESSFQIGGQSVEGPVLEVLTRTFERLHAERDAVELSFICKWLLEMTTKSLTNDNSIHLTWLFTLLISTVQNDYVGKITDFEPLISLVDLTLTTKNVGLHSKPELIEKVLQLMLCIIGGLSTSKNMPALQRVSTLWGPVFEIRSHCLLNFIGDLLTKDPSIYHVFGTNIICALNNLIALDIIEISDEEVVYLMMKFCEKLEVKSSRFWDEESNKFSRILGFCKGALQDCIGVISSTAQGNLFPIQKNKLAVLWAIIGCYSHLPDDQENPSLLLDFINAVDDKLLMVESKLAGFQQNTWYSLIGAALRSYNKLVSKRGNAHEESAVRKFWDLARRYKLSPQILSAVMDILDTVSVASPGKCQFYLPEKSLDVFSENLRHPNRVIRLSTLCILFHYEPLHDKNPVKKLPIENYSVLNLLRSIEETAPSIATSCKVTLLITELQMSLSAHRVADQYIIPSLNGIFGLLHNRFSHFWKPALECLSVLLGQYFGIVWKVYIEYLEQCQSNFLASHHQHDGGDDDSTEDSGLVGCFNSDIIRLYDSTPCATVLSLLIQSLQNVPSIVELQSEQIVPLFLKFLGYNAEELTSADSCTLDHRGKKWKGILKEWLSLFRLLQNPRAFKHGQFLRDVLLYRLLDQNDADLQTIVLDCLLNWKDEFLLPYSGNLKNLINEKTLQDELTKWSLSKTSMDSLDERHRADLVPVIIRILIPKVRNLKMLGTKKNACVHRRQAVLRFLAMLELEELPLFFWLLVKSLLAIPQSGAQISKKLWGSSKSPEFEFDASDILKHLTSTTIETLPWKKKYCFLNVLQDILKVFDESRLHPFLKLLMNCVAQISASCTSAVFDSEKEVNVNTKESKKRKRKGSKKGNQGSKKGNKGSQRFRDLSSLCLKVVSRVLTDYDGHDFGGAFWDLFFTSVKPFVAELKEDLKKEDLCSQKPSSLFCCFLAMSKSYKLVPLLSNVENLVPDIFSMLSAPPSSKSILDFILEFAENLLNLDNSLGCEDVTVKSVLLPHLDKLICGLHCIFTNENVTKRPLLKFPGKREITIFNLLSKYVKEPTFAESFVDILLPFLTKKHQNFDTCVHALQIIRQLVTVVGSGKSKKILNSVSPLLISADLAVRNSICDVLDAVASNDSSFLTLANILRELNAASAMEMSGLDIDKVGSAYEKVNADFFYTIEEEHAMPILAQAVHDTSSKDFREKAFGLLLSFIEFSGEILNGSREFDTSWSRAGIQSTVNYFLLKHMGNAMNKEGADEMVLMLWMNLLREMVLKLPKEANLDSYKDLWSVDTEQDFFYNILHMQKHRRARAVSRFSEIVSSGDLSKVITYQVFVPMLFRMLFDLQDGKDEHIRSACIDALASISGCMKSGQYSALLDRCFCNLALKPDRQKLLSRLICAILDKFHFTDSSLKCEAKVSASDASDSCNIDMSILTRYKESLHNKLFPKVQKLLISDSDNVNVHISLVALKLLKLLPSDIRDLQLPTVVYRISNFLKNHLESVRNEARSALFVCLKELGLECLQYLVKVLNGILKRGYELHVLGYTLNFLLSKFLESPICGKLDYCLNDLLSVVAKDILGDVSEEKEVEKIASKMKETRKQKSYETLKLLAQNVTFKTCALKLLSPVTDHLQQKKQLTQKLKLKLENMLNHIAAGIEYNPSVQQTELFVFVYELVKDGIGDEFDERANRYILQADNRIESVQTTETNRLVNVDRQFSHLLTAFALGVLHNYMKRLKLNPEDGHLLSLLDPFVSLLAHCLSSKYENIMTAAFRCLSLVVRLPLPSLQWESDKIKNSLLVIAQGSVNVNSQLTESCMKLLTMLLRSERVTLSADQLHMLIQFPLFVELSKRPSFIALLLLKAIIHRKLVVPEIYDLVQIVADLMVQSQDEPIRRKCSQIFLQFLRGYKISEKRLQQHLDFLLANLSYEHSTGREAVLEMLNVIILKFQNVVDTQSETLFMHLVKSLANDDDRKVRSISAAAIKCLIGNVRPPSLHLILEYCLSWYRGTKQSIRCIAAQVLGFLVEVTGKSFQTHLNKVLPVMRDILHSSVNALTSSQPELSDDAVPFWKESYYSLVMLEKILSQFHNMFLDTELEDIWDTICKLLLHPHLWLRKISCRIISSYFAAVTSACRDNSQVSADAFYLMKPGILFHIAVSLCCQLKVPSGDDASGIIIMKNLVFSICGLHSILEKKENMDVSSFWSSLHRAEQDRFLEAFGILDRRKGKRTLESFISDASCEHDKRQHPFISYLLQRVGKITFQMEANEMRIIFNCYKSISPKLLACYGTPSPPIGNDDVRSFAYQLLLPLYRVCEGYTGQVVSDDLKQSAQDVSESIRDMINVHNFVKIYSHIGKNLKVKRDKRKQGEKVMAVVNPTQNAKRKLRIAAKHRAHKKRKIMSMKMG